VSGKPPPLTPQQQELVARAIEKVTKAVHKKAPLVAAFCGLECEDVKQEAVLAACRAATTWRPERGPFLPYAQTAALIHMQLLLRRAQVARRSGRPVSLDRVREPVSKQAGPSEADVDAAVRLLPKACREAVLADFLDRGPRRRGPGPGPLQRAALAVGWLAREGGSA
jgi:DNA-directed RNA polymerase specialized sigma24 family protein